VLRHPHRTLESSSIIRVPHLQAALAVWDYCSAGASRLFGTFTGDPTADRIREATPIVPAVPLGRRAQAALQIPMHNGRGGSAHGCLHRAPL
jgi:hypothetical protein